MLGAQFEVLILAINLIFKSDNLKYKEMILNELSEQNGVCSLKKCMLYRMIDNWSLTKSAAEEQKESTYDYPKQKRFFLHEDN